MVLVNPGLIIVMCVCAALGVAALAVAIVAVILYRKDN